MYRKYRDNKSLALRQIPTFPAVSKCLIEVSKKVPFHQNLVSPKRLLQRSVVMGERQQISKESCILKIQQPREFYKYFSPFRKRWILLSGFGSFNELNDIARNRFGTVSMLARQWIGAGFALTLNTPRNKRKTTKSTSLRLASSCKMRSLRWGNWFSTRRSELDCLLRHLSI